MDVRTPTRIRSEKKRLVFAILRTHVLLAMFLVLSHVTTRTYGEDERGEKNWTARIAITTQSSRDKTRSAGKAYDAPRSHEYSKPTTVDGKALLRPSSNFRAIVIIIITREDCAHLIHSPSDE